MRRSVVTGAAAVAAGIALAACGGSGSKAPAANAPAATTLDTVQLTTPPTTTAAAPAAPLTGEAAAVGKTWTTFFSSATPAAQQQSLLQNGSTYVAQLATLRKLMAGNIGAKVVSVAVHGSTANVTYDILSNGSPLLSGSTGTAVQVGGKWLVSSGTFCGLATLAGAACTG